MKITITLLVAAAIAFISYLVTNLNQVTPTDSHLDIMTKETEKRIALLILNNGYTSAPLPATISDGNKLASILRSLNFEVMVAENSDREETIRTIRKFGDNVSGKDIALFFYAGHALQFNGHNFLLSPRSDIKDGADLELEGIDIGLILAQMAAEKNLLKIILLDSGYTYPPAQDWGIEQGLALMNAPPETIISYATIPNSQIEEIQKGSSLYSKNLRVALMQPDLSIEQVFKKVRSNVRQQSDNKQTPWESTSLETAFYFDLEYYDRNITQPAITPLIKRPKFDKKLAYNMLQEARELKQQAQAENDERLFNKAREKLEEALRLVSDSSKAYREISDERYLHLPWMEMNHFLTEFKPLKVQLRLNEMSDYLKKNPGHPHYTFHKRRLDEHQRSLTFVERGIDKSNKSLYTYFKVWIGNYKKGEGHLPEDLPEFIVFSQEYSLNIHKDITINEYHTWGNQCTLVFTDTNTNKQYTMDFQFDSNP